MLVSRCGLEVCRLAFFLLFLFAKIVPVSEVLLTCLPMFRGQLREDRRICLPDLGLDLHTTRAALQFLKPSLLARDQIV
jgi:hypothetical protein